MTTLIAKESHNTTCPYCGVGCGVSVQVENNSITSLKGNKNHPANEGRLCVKGSSLHETLGQQNRLLTPTVNGQETSWDEALDYVASEWQSIIKEHGTDAVAFYLSGQLLTEDYYVANKLMKGFVGSSNIDTNSRLCMASAVVAHKRAFGSDAVPGCYEDLECTDVLLLVGSNTAYAHPIVYQRIVKAKKERDLKIVVLDPRRTATCEIADLHIPLKPGTDAFFFNGLLSYLAANNAIDLEYIAAHCDGFDETLTTAQQQVPDLNSAAQLCDVDIHDLQQAYELFASNEKVVTLFSQGINQSSSGVDKGNAIINCHLATGKIGKEGSAPFSITGQPNAMGGREVGGLSNQLAAHMNFNEADIKCVETFWQAPNIAKQEGLKAVDMFEAVHAGKIKAIWIMATNPVVSMPAANRVKEALEKCPLVIVSDCMKNTDTGAVANVLLPATSWSEKNGTSTNSERCISIQKGFLKAPGEAKPDWQIISEFAAKLGFGDNFSYSHPIEIFREHATLSSYQNNNTRAFNISALTNISLEDYQNFQPTRWPVTENKPTGTQRLFTDGQFYTPNRRAQLIPIKARLPMQAPREGELIMNTGRVRDQWHTMTRTGKVPRLLNHVSEPYVQIHPDDAERLSIQENTLVELQNKQARFLGRAKISSDQRRGETFVPIHWNNVYTSLGRADALVNAFVDPIGGQPEFKHSPAQTRSYPAAWYGALLTCNEVQPQCEYWAKMTIQSGFNFSLADKKVPEDWQAWLNTLQPDISDWISLTDSTTQLTRFIGFINNRLSAALVITEDHNNLPDMQWLATQLDKEIEPLERFTLLAASSGDDTLSPGPIICSCFEIGENQINDAIKQGCCSTEALGQTLKCGTNCGSCIPELSALLKNARS
jgi:assimilatory nitrate reductase catalytic subunit